MEDLKQMLENNDYALLEETLSDYHPSDTALWISVYDPAFRKAILKNLSDMLAADILNYMDKDLARETLDEFTTPEASKLIIEMDTDEATDLLKSLSAKQRKSILSAMKPKDRHLMNRFLGYDEESAGAIMTSDAIVLEETMDVKEAMKTLIDNAVSTESIQRLFVTSNDGVLKGVLELKDLIQARSPLTITEIMQGDPVAVHETTPAEEAAKTMRNYQLYLLPVVDEHGVIQGAITLDDALDILEEAGEEDYARFANISMEASVRDSLFRSAFHRLPWLAILLGLGLIISGIIAVFENTLSEVTVLVLFQPLILGMAGNTGTQSLAVTIRGLGNQYYQDREEAREHIKREFKSGMINGVVIGVLGFLTTISFLFITGAMDANPWLVATSVAGALFFALSVASIFGASIPLLLHRLGFDPAAASGPFITTLNDVLALTIYFTLASLIIVAL
ncbi:MAG: magnesium transporter [Bacillota bacterium]